MSGEATGNGERYQPPAAELARWRVRCLLVGGIAGASCLVGVFLDRPQFLRSYLVAWLFWLGVALGCFAVAMLHHLSRGAWGLMIRRPLEAASRTLPLLALLFVPIGLGLSELYPWARPDEVAADALLRQKAWWLNPGFFLGRAALYFAIWIAFAWILNRLSLQQDRTGDSRLFRRMQLIAGPGLALYCLAATFAAVDWLMSLDPHWYSSLFGVYFVGGQAVAAFAFTVPVALFLSAREPMGGVFKPIHFHDYGKLLLAFVMLWTYFALSQFLIIWSGNLQEEVVWYQVRQQGGWLWVGIALILLHFALPFLLLLSRDLKRNARSLAAVALLLLAMRWVDLYWQAGPALHPGAVPIHWLDVATVAGIGGLWLAAFLWQLAQRPLLPVNDPYLPEALAHEP